MHTFYDNKILEKYGVISPLFRTTTELHINELIDTLYFVWIPENRMEIILVFANYPILLPDMHSDRYRRGGYICRSWAPNREDVTTYQCSSRSLAFRIPGHFCRLLEQS